MKLSAAAEKATAAAAAAKVFAAEASAAAAKAIAAAGEAAAAAAELVADDGWQVVVAKATKKKRSSVDEEPTEKTLTVNAPPFEPEIKLFETSTQMEALFLMGIGGRNVSLIRKHTGVAIYIRDGGSVWMMAPSRWPTNAKPQKAWAMVLSACCGGILRWFATPAATQRWYSVGAPEIKALAERNGCALELLRSRTGHMCLMLVPNGTMLFDSPTATTPTDAGVAAVRAMLPSVREEMMRTLGEAASLIP